MELIVSDSSSQNVVRTKRMGIEVTYNLRSVSQTEALNRSELGIKKIPNICSLNEWKPSAIEPSAE